MGITAASKGVRPGPRFQLQDLLFSLAGAGASPSRANGKNYKPLRADSVTIKQPETQEKSFSWQQDLQMRLQDSQRETECLFFLRYKLNSIILQVTEKLQ